MAKEITNEYIVWDEASQGYVLDAEQKVRDDVEKHYWRGVFRTAIKDWRLYLMLVPMLLVFFLWRYLPMYELLGCFKFSIDGTPVAEQTYVGLEYFKRILYADVSLAPTFWRAFRNTFTISFYGLCFAFPMPIILALMFNEIRSNGYRSVLQVMTYLPKFMSTVIITSLTLLLFSGARAGGGAQPGIIAGILSNLGVVPEADAVANMMHNPDYFRPIYIITGIWEGAGYDSIVYFAAVIAISPTSYEAAQIDGAGKLAQMRYVVLPSILSTITIMLILRIGHLLSVGYEKIYLLYNTSTWEVADVVSTLAMRQGGMGGTKGAVGTGIASASEMLNNITGMLLVIGANAISKKASNVSLY